MSNPDSMQFFVSFRDQLDALLEDQGSRG